MEKNVKLVDLFMSYDNMENKRILEERLKKAVWSGHTDVIQELLNLGVDVNARNPIDGWTPLHWACKKGFLDIAALLLKNGADKNIRSDIGETPAFVCTNPQILQLLDVPVDSQRTISEPAVHNAMPKYMKNDYMHGIIDSGIPRIKNNSVYQDELVLKIRIADAPDPDFIEIELPQNDLTYQALIRICSQELNVDPNQIVKLRKLPNTRLRKDEDIQRLQNFQEIEVITNTTNTYKYTQNTNGVANNIPITPANGYQSISKKDQTILY
ncbi:ankyrin repeat domain-containing protein 40 isoform X1 [Xylocopa sonorina]|uniref:ankyrin repeat domain-containing protein 40 isoform X1 n=1 Tax=Xylocopa sonorina TaxID=1818115 RepID=UPI00403A7C80